MELWIIIISILILILIFGILCLRKGGEGKKTFTHRELAAYNGITKPQVYLACNKAVFDVSKSSNYKGTGPYSMFAGKDVSVALGKMSFDPKDIEDKDVTKLTPEQRSAMLDWYSNLKTNYNYPIVGTIVQETETTKIY